MRQNNSGSMPVAVCTATGAVTAYSVLATLRVVYPT